MTREEMLKRKQQRLIKKFWKTLAEVMVMKKI